MVRLEHANLHAADVDGMIRFLKTAFPEFEIRADQVRAEDGVRWVHVGTPDTYIAVYAASREPGHTRQLYNGEPQVNHLGYVVDDAEALRARLRSAGYRDTTVENHHPHRKRIYFEDPEGNEWEFVEYFSDDPAERNDYQLAG